MDTHQHKQCCALVTLISPWKVLCSFNQTLTLILASHTNAVDISRPNQLIQEVGYDWKIWKSYSKKEMPQWHLYRQTVQEWFHHMEMNFRNDSQPAVLMSMSYKVVNLNPYISWLQRIHRVHLITCLLTVWHYHQN